MQWNATTSHKIGVQAAKPYELLSKLCGDKRLNDINKRMEEYLPKWDQRSDCIYAGLPQVLLPNPLAYVQKEQWAHSQREWEFPVGHIHGDLHTGNVICGDAKVDQNYQIIDFSEYRKDGVPFFDLAYLEFDIIRQVLPLTSYESKVSWWYVLTSIMREIIPPYQLVRDEQAQYAEQLIQPIRYHVNTLINRADDRMRKGFKLAWWLAVYSVGLNYARKRDADRKPEERIAALLYAAFGLHHALHLLNISYEHRAAAAPVVAWIQEKDFRLVSAATR